MKPLTFIGITTDAQNFPLRYDRNAHHDVTVERPEEKLGKRQLQMRHISPDLRRPRAPQFYNTTLSGFLAHRILNTL